LSNSALKWRWQANLSVGLSILKGPMTDFEAKVLRYLREHKRPTHPKKLAELWLVSQVRVAMALRALARDGLAVAVQKTPKLYRAAREDNQ
jgi:DNA-binding MarR family transcriptional regulator